jgi:hypothetical protein
VVTTTALRLPIDIDLERDTRGALEVARARLEGSSTATR